MKKFKDNLGQEWVLSLNLGKVRKFRDRIGLDLLHPQHHLQVLQSKTDRLTFVFMLCEEQSKKYEVNVDEFEERLYGEGFADAASDAFLEDLADFYQRLGEDGLAGMTVRSLATMRKARKRLVKMMKTGEFTSVLDRAESQMETMLQDEGGNGSQDSEQSAV